MAAHCLLGFLALFCYFLLLHLAADEKDYNKECPKSFPCGYLGHIHFPFTNVTSECSLDIMGCDNPDPGAIKVLLKNQSYEIESIYQEGEFNLISIYGYNSENPLCSRNGCATVIPPNSSMMHFHVRNSITFYKCFHNSNNDEALKNKYLFKTCSALGSPFDIYYSSESYIPITDGNFPSFPSACSVVQHPFGQLPSSTEPCIFFTSILEIEVILSESCLECYVVNGSQCSLDMKKKQCVDPNVQPDKEHNDVPPLPPLPPLGPPVIENNGRDLKKVKIIGLSFGLAGTTTIACFAILLLYKRRYNSSGYQNRPRNIYSGPYSNTNPESGTVYFGIPVFSYEELQEATNNFDQARELGEGGFGTVYYGMLRDGREVAVKRLFERNYRPVESFINEIQILTRLRHRNLVSLYGCTSRHSRELLLVYEYIPNGTVSYHLHGDKAKPGSLPWPVRMKIAIETASALTYLHASDIIHRDVKTSNILLDNNFCVKVADFGLSRLFPNDVTHVSTAPRGTPGYVDPDYRICYQLTSKSDVYSFGVVLVELISSLPAVDMSRDRDEIKLANLAIRKIQKRAFCELVDPSLGFQSDDKLKKMITSVAELAFQCLQGDKELRPSMGEVLEVLKRIESGNDEPGNLEGIDVHGVRVSHSYAHPALPNSLMKPQRLHQTL